MVYVKVVVLNVCQIINLQIKFISQLLEKILKRGVYYSFKHNILGVDLADMQLIIKYNRGIRVLLCAIDLFSKHAWVFPLRDKKGVIITNAFKMILNSSKRKPNKIWVNQGNEFYNRSFNKWLEDNDIKMYSTHNEGKSVVAEGFIRTLENKIYKHMAAVSKNVYIDFLDDIVDEYNNTYHNTIKIKPIDVKSDSYAEYNVDSNEKYPKFNVADHVRISKYKNNIAKVYAPNWQKKIWS